MVVQVKSKEESQGHCAPGDLSILTLVMQQRAIRFDQLSRFIALLDANSGSAHEAALKSTAHHLIERLQREGLLRLQHFRKDQPAWIWLTKKGLHALGSSSSWKRPARSALPILYAANAVRLLLTEHEPQGTWMSRQQLRTIRTGENTYQLPMAEFLAETGERMAIHVALRLTSTVERIATRMLQQLDQATSSRESYYTALWYYASPDDAKRLRAARAIVAEVTTKELARRICIFSYPLIQDQLIYTGHHAPVRALAWSADGRRLASVGEEFHVWNATTGKEQFRAPIPAVPSVVGWSCDGSWIGLGGDEGGLSVWAGATGEAPLMGVEAAEKITGLAWSPQQNDLLAWCSAGGTLQLHDVRQNAFQWSVQCICGAASLAWSPDGTRLAVGENDSVVCLFNATTGKHLRTFKKHYSAVQTLAWSPDSQQLASAGGGHAVLIWDATTGKKRRTIWSRLSSIDVLAWSPDGTRLACAGSDPCVQVWNTHTGRLLQVYKDHADAINGIAWSPDSRMLASASDDGTVQLYPAAGGSQ